MGNYEIVQTHTHTHTSMQIHTHTSATCWGEIAQRQTHNNCLSQGVMAGGEKPGVQAKDCNSWATKSQGQSPLQELCSSLAGENEIEEEQTLSYCYEIPNPAHASSRLGKMVLPSGTVLPSPEGRLPLWMEHRKAASLVWRMVLNNLKE